jgi:TRAP-type C4-dicarboxylate transport system permease small subunit
MTPSPAGSSDGLLARADRALEAVLRWVSTACLAFLGVLVCALVFVRFFPILALDWSDEIVELAFAWMVFLGTAAVWRSREHISIDFVPQALAGTRAGRTLDLILSLLSLGFLAVFTWEGWRLAVLARDTSPMLALPRPLWYAALPVSGLVMMGYSMRRCLKTIRSAARHPKAAEDSPRKNSRGGRRIR